MPNWATNTLRISGPKTLLKRFREKAVGRSPWAGDNEEEMLCCNSFVPAPNKAIDDYSNVGYSWCIKNWGTKWGCCDIALTERPRSLIYDFNSAWSPPLPVVLEMSKQFPQLKFSLRYYEGGMAFQGLFRCQGGEVIQDKSEDYHGQRGG